MLTDITAPAGLCDYRSGVEQLVLGYEARMSATSQANRGLTRGERDHLHTLVTAVTDFPTDVEGRLDREVRAFHPTARSNATSPATLLRILLLQQIDVLWWANTAPLVDDAAVRSSAELVSLAAEHRQGRLAFRFKVAPTTLPGRARNFAVRRWAAGYEPRSSGLSFGSARPAMIGLLNEVAGRLAAAAPRWGGRMWVNCIVRSVEGQQQLRELGYSALLPSAHCVGFAADIEMTWLRGQGVAEPLQEILLSYRDAGVLNVIDEGQAWHVCLNPDHVDRYVGRYARAAATPGTG